jgi:low affinity Fe/Cu permease
MLASCFAGIAMPADAAKRQAESESRQPTGLRAVNAALERLAVHAARWSASSFGFAFAAGVVLVWLLLGPWLHYSESWQLVINTGTTIVTFLMVFLIQRSQSKDALALQLKLDEVVAALSTASNELVAVEDLSEEDLEELRRRYHELSERARHVKTRVERAQADRSRKAPARPRPHARRDPPTRES